MKSEIKYLDQINAFNTWTEFNYLSANAQLLWFKLMHIWNRTRWQETFQVDNFRLISAIGASSERPLRNARNELIKAGLIEFKKGYKRCPSTYKINPFIRAKDGTFDLQINGTKDYQKDSKPHVEDEINSPIDGTFSGTKYRQNVTQTENSDINVPITDGLPVQNTGKKSTNVPTYKDKDIDKDIEYIDLTNVKSSSTDEQSTTSSSQPKIDYNALVDFWNIHHGNMPTIKSINGTRRQSVRARINEYSKSDFKKAILKAEQSDFLNGRAKDFIANFDWIIKPRNFAKVLEGNYDNHDFKQPTKEIAFNKPSKTKFDSQREIDDWLMYGDRNDRTGNQGIDYDDENVVSGVLFELDTGTDQDDDDVMARCLQRLSG